MDHSHELTVLATIRRLKEGPLLREPWLPISLGGRAAAWLEPVTWLDAERHESLSLLTPRDEAIPDRPSTFVSGSIAETQRWLIRQLLQVPERLLFWVTGIDGARIGHVGLHRFDFAGRGVELENLLRRSHDVLPGIMTAATQTLLAWTFDTLRMESVSVQLLSDNERALRLCERCGFWESKRTPVGSMPAGEGVQGVGTGGGTRVTMRLLRTDWETPNRRGDVAA